MSMMFCEKCDHLYDTDLETECPGCEEEDQQDEERAMKEERETEYGESYQHPAEGND